MIVVAKVVGAVLAIAGIVLAVDPEIVAPPVEAATLFEAVEQHVRWGWLIALGLVLLLFVRSRPWPLIVATVGVAIPLGYGIARVIGISLLGADSKQWYWLIAEAILVAIFFVWYLKQRNALTSAELKDKH